MPAPLSDAQRHGALKLLLEGHSFGQAASEIGCSKGFISSIWGDFKSGQMPGFENLEDYADLIRETAVELRNSGVSPEDAAMGMAALRYLAKVNLEPNQLGEYSQLFDRLSKEENPSEVIQAALELQKLEAVTGLDYQTLLRHTRELDERKKNLEIEVVNLEGKRDEIHSLLTRERGLKEEVERLSTERDRLHEDVGQRERREEHLTDRVIELEARSAVAEERLAVSRKATEDLGSLGLDVEDLPGLAQRLGAIAAHHRWNVGELFERLLAELEKLELKLTLETMKAELQGLGAEKIKAQSTLSGLRKQQKRLEGHQLTLGNQASANLEKIGRQIAASTLKAAELLRIQHESLVQKSLELGENVGRLEAELRTHEWLGPLLGLVAGNEDLQPEKVRSLALMFLKSLHNWVSRNPVGSLAGARWSIQAQIRSFEEWNI